MLDCVDFPRAGAVKLKEAVVVGDESGAVAHADKADAGALDELIELGLVFLVEGAGRFI